MSRDDAPAELIALADARAEARRGREWATADALKARIEAAGWKVIDTGTFYDLERAVAPDIERDGIVRHGSSGSVPSRLDETAVGVATVVLIATDQADDLARTVGAIAEHAPDGTRVVVVANGASETIEQLATALDSADPGAPGIITEVVWTSTRLGWAAALNAGIRRATAPMVLLLDPSIELVGDLVTVLAGALEDPIVALAGPFGLVSDDQRMFHAAPPDALMVDAVEGVALAFRRADYVERGPLDEHFIDEASLDAWWSLVLRDPTGTDDAPEDGTPRQALQVGTGLVERHPRALPGWLAQPEHERLARRNRYRLLKRFATRRDLLVATSSRDPG
jgi:hypothetical protein